jgi:hypothetical protein
MVRGPTSSLTQIGSTVFGRTRIGGDNVWGTVFAIVIPEPRVPGDYNEDGTVEAADYVAWRDNEGTSNDPAKR